MIKSMSDDEGRVRCYGFLLLLSLPLGWMAISTLRRNKKMTEEFGDQVRPNG